MVFWRSDGIQIVQIDPQKEVEGLKSESNLSGR